MPQLMNRAVLYDGTDRSEILVLGVDPVTGAPGPGTPAPEGSIALTDNGGVGELWVKTGPADIDWTIVQTDEEYYKGTTVLAPGVGTQVIGLPAANAAATYVVHQELLHDPADPIISLAVQNRTVNDFTATLAGPTPSANYSIMWSAQIL